MLTYTVCFIFFSFSQNSPSFLALTPLGAESHRLFLLPGFTGHYDGCSASCCGLERKPQGTFSKLLCRETVTRRNVGLTPASIFPRRPPGSRGRRLSGRPTRSDRIPPTERSGWTCGVTSGCNVQQCYNVFQLFSMPLILRFIIYW